MTDRDLIAWLKRTADGNPTHVCYIAADRIADLEGRLLRIDDAVQAFLAGDASEPVGTIYRLHRIAIGTEEAR